MNAPFGLRPTMRVRLTLLYASAFFLAGALLVGLMHVFMSQALERQMTTRVLVTQEQLGGLPPGGAVRILPREVQEALNEQFRQDRDNTLNAMLVASLVSLAVVGVAAGGLGWLLAGQALQPLRQITATARRVADRSLHERIGLEGPSDEIKDLADTFDAMLERLDRAFDSQRRFVANASHELRTPLTINRTLIEVAIDDPAAGESLRQLGGTLLAVNQRHERLIDGLLTLAGSEQRLADTERVDLAEVAGHVVAECRSAADDGHVELRLELDPAAIEGDPVLLERMVRNLVDNAIVYNLPAEGWVRVSTEQFDGRARLTIENVGPVIPRYELAGLFEPFRRLSATDRVGSAAAGPAARGAGLGLSIVRSVAHAHGGEVHAEPRAGGGLRVEVDLPTARTPDEAEPHAGSKRRSRASSSRSSPHSNSAA